MIFLEFKGKTLWMKSRKEKFDLWTHKKEILLSICEKK